MLRLLGLLVSAQRKGDFFEQCVDVKRKGWSTGGDICGFVCGGGHSGQGLITNRQLLMVDKCG